MRKIIVLGIAAASLALVSRSSACFPVICNPCGWSWHSCFGGEGDHEEDHEGDHDSDHHGEGDHEGDHEGDDDGGTHSCHY